MKRSFEKDMPSGKGRKRRGKIKKLPKLTFSSKTTIGTTSTSTSTPRLVSSIAEAKEEWSVYSETFSETEGEGTMAF
jgi:hypothetical protein